MFTWPQNTIAYLLKEPIDMRYGMFRLQGVIAQLMQQPMPRGAFCFFINKGHSLLKAVWFDGTGLCLLTPPGQPCPAGSRAGIRRKNRPVDPFFALFLKKSEKSGGSRG